MQIGTGRKTVFSLTPAEQKLLEYLSIRTTNNLKEMAVEFGKNDGAFRSLFYKVKDKCFCDEMDTKQFLEWIDEQKGENNV